MRAKSDLFEDGGGFNHIRAQLPNLIRPTHVAFSLIRAQLRQHNSAGASRRPRYFEDLMDSRRISAGSTESGKT
ncbi:MAG TPA: hypothetical protein VFS24_06440 [Steroidobacteraceae bacterium]|nr:hypothetical protein [Steroidobacteraceae bacterium]